MRSVLAVLALSLALPLLLSGCGSKRSMTDSEFLGFCHSAEGRKGACDSVGLCDAYLKSVGRPQTGLKSCLDGCVDVQRQLNAQMGSQGCAGALKSGNDWCQRYCRNLFPE